MPAISVEQLRKIYKVPVREGGLAASLKSLFKREYTEVLAVDGVSFEIEPGEVVGFLGPNGAGKTTTLKMLAGLLFPTDGKAEVLGHIPSERRKEFLGRMALVMGNRNSLQWDLPAIDSFELNRAIYQIPRADYEERRDRSIELLEVGDLINKPIRNLSLGERMKMEIIGSLLHQPEVLFLDEPTIGLDITMQKRLRNFVAEYSRDTGAAVMLTSHYMADVVALAERVIVIHHGVILFDGNLAGLSERFTSHKTITLAVSGELPPLDGYGEVIESQNGKATLKVARIDVSAAAARLLTDFQIIDLTIEDPPIEDVIEQAFAIEMPTPKEAAEEKT